MSSRHETQRREKNRSSLKDYLDGVLAGLHPGSPDPEQMPDDNKKGSRILLYERSLKRFEKPEQHRTHRLLTEVLMVNENSRLAVEDRLAHSALCEFVFPYGYQALLRLEEAAERGDPLAEAPAELCGRGFEEVLDYLDELDYVISAPVLPQSRIRDFKTVERRQDEARRVFKMAVGHMTEDDAIKQTAEVSGYSASQIRRITSDLRAVKGAS